MIWSTRLGLAEPVAIIACDVDAGDTRQSDYNMTVGVSFKNSSEQTITAVKFDFNLLDTFGNTLSTQNGTVTGSFAPGILIQPRRVVGGSMLQLTPNTMVSRTQNTTSPAWYVRNTFGRDLSNVRCGLNAVRFADGTLWNPATEPPGGAPPSPTATESPGGAPSTPSATESPTTARVDIAVAHLWQGAGASENPIIAGHPKYCTVKESVSGWETEACHYARIQWSIQSKQIRSITSPHQLQSAASARSNIGKVSEQTKAPDSADPFIQNITIDGRASVPNQTVPSIFTVTGLANANAQIQILIAYEDPLTTSNQFVQADANGSFSALVDSSSIGNPQRFTLALRAINKATKASSKIFQVDLHR